MTKMVKQVSASDAKHKFGGLLDEVAAAGRVEILKHGRVVAVLLSPSALQEALRSAGRPGAVPWGANHMIAPHRARSARMIRPPASFDD